jgi:ribosomal-protein-serine acetyltransferase
VFTLPLDDGLDLALREPHGAGAFAALVGANRSHLARWFSWAETADEATARRWAAQGLEQFRRGQGFHGTLLVGGRPVGALGVHALERTRGTAEIGYWLAEAEQGNGLMTRAMRALLAYLFVGLGLQKVAIAADVRNGRSIAIAERLGFSLEGVLRGASTVPGERRGDEARYGLLREEWEARHHGPLPPCARHPRFRLDIGDGVALALLERDDADALAALVRENDEHLAPWFPWVAGASTETTRAFIEERALPALAGGHGFESGIVVEGRIVGTFGVHSVDLERGSAELGYWLAHAFEGRGLVTRASEAVIHVLFEERGFERVEVRADVVNARSRAVPERLGFRHEATLRRTLWNGRDAVDVAVYGLLRDEWRQRRARGGSAQHSA